MTTLRRLRALVLGPVLMVLALVALALWWSPSTAQHANNENDTAIPSPIQRLHEQLETVKGGSPGERVKVLSRLQSAYASHGRFEEAERYCREALRLGHGNLPFGHLALQRVRQALAHYLARKPPTAEGKQYLLERLAAARTNTKGASVIFWVRLLVEHHSASGDLRGALAVVDMELRRARESCQRTKRTCEMVGRYLLVRGEALVAAEDASASAVYGEAIDELEKAPGSPASIYLPTAGSDLAQVLLAAGDESGAERAYRKSIGLWAEFAADPDHAVDLWSTLPDLLDNLATLLESSGRLQEAEELRHRSESLRVSRQQKSD